MIEIGDEIGALMVGLRRAIHLHHYSSRTEQAYAYWTRRYLAFYGGRDLRGLAGEAMDGFLTHLAVVEGVAAATQNQALCALVFLYRHVLKIDAIWLRHLVRAKRPHRAPTVLSRREIQSILEGLDGSIRLATSMLYGSGLRKMELLRLCVRDVDPEKLRIHVRSGKGDKDRLTLLSAALREPVHQQIRQVAELYSIQSETAVGSMFLFPAQRPVRNQQTGQWGYVPMCPTVLSRAIRRSARRAGIAKNVNCHAFRHSFATHLLEDGCDIRTLQELMGHQSVRTTMIYTHVLHQPERPVCSPLDHGLAEEESVI